MRQVLFVLLGGLLYITSLAAQPNSFNQRGGATGELQVGGLNAAHSSLPLNSRAKIINTVTGKEVDVTIIAHIPVSANRIVDLSPDAWQALDMEPDTPVIVFAGQTAVPPTALSQTPAAPPVPPAPNPLVQNRPAPRPVQPAQPPVVFPPPAAPVIHRPQTPVRIDVIPGWPNPHSQKIYILQVGSFSSPEAATVSEYWVRVAGFEVAREIHDSMYRVLVMNIPAASIQPAIQRLAAFGFKQFWVREQR